MLPSAFVSEELGCQKIKSHDRSKVVLSGLQATDLVTCHFLVGGMSQVVTRKGGFFERDEERASARPCNF